jgi:quinol monooxygenase YgiN
MVVVLAHITVVPGREPEFEAAARRLTAVTLSSERGIRRYEYIRMFAPSTYLATLAFVDYDAFLEHQASQHHFVIAGGMRDLISTMRLEQVDPVPGCSLLAPSPTAAVDQAIEPVEAHVLSARREHYRERYPLDPAAWWGTAP